MNEFRKIDTRAYPTNVRTVIITNKAMSWNWFSSILIGEQGSDNVICLNVDILSRPRFVA